MEEKIKGFCEYCGLGGVRTMRPVSGGLLHTMYKVKTSTGVYAVKVLNPEVMRRPKALQNMTHSEKIAHELERVVPLVAAKEFEGSHTVKWEGTWFMVFDWLDGVSLFTADITTEHCGKIGDALGKIHAANVQIEGIIPETEVRKEYDWSLLEDEYLPELTELDAEVVRALKVMSSHQVISHRDLDPKNVMWQSGKPYIIDWEAAGYVNPYQELVEVLNYWIADETGSQKFRKFEALMSAYAAHMPVDSVDWDSVLLCSFDGMLGWLEYNVRRAAGQTGNNAKDREEGKKQVTFTIAEIKQQRTQLTKLRRRLYEFK